ncbi:PolC-type DNA polymerase III [Peptostreptococcus anaerobius]|uniref:Exonuclease, DNA polymerase III, epsilon subunit family n=1 Tax=Peptostreptococcus anaerobius 653-L TaxID=596329 RepID=D3MU36_9FIRM|nr:3'-5' exonuclease [Peptostreptococcus anaerobius]EFD04373.1 exonuclease, DNA polymerase III, epsilon subunit family [Peptostreptococcus anaerobius 653-L]
MFLSKFIKNRKDKKLNKYIYENLKNDYTVIDIETSGLNPEKNEILELGAVRVRDNIVVAEYEQLIRPRKSISKEATKVNGLTKRMLIDEPFVEDVIWDFKDFLGKDVLIGHNIEFDLEFIRNQLPIRNKYIDTLPLARKLLKIKRHRLIDICHHYKIPEPNHRSISDCNATHLCYQKMKEPLKKLETL